MNIRKHLVAVAAVAALIVLPVLASADTWTLDESHSAVGFRVKHLGITWVNGTFDKVEGTIDWDGKTVSTGKATVTIQAGSVNTRIAKRDEDLRKAFFDVEKFPTITFVSKSVTAAGKDTSKVTGDLTIKGVTKEVTLDVTHLGNVEKDPWGMTRAAFQAKTTIKRGDFGVVSGNAISNGTVGENVEITIDIEAILKK